MMNRGKKGAPYLWVAVLALAAGFIGGLTAGRFSADRPVFASESPKEIKARAFQLVDGHGSIHAALRMLEGEGPGLEFYDDAHRPRVLFDMTGEGDPRVFLLDAEGSIRTVVGLGLGDGGYPFIRMRDKEGKVIWSAPPPKSGKAPAGR
jgi:hypothetical protein